MLVNGVVMTEEENLCFLLALLNKKFGGRNHVCENKSIPFFAAAAAPQGER